METYTNPICDDCDLTQQYKTTRLRLEEYYQDNCKICKKLEHIKNEIILDPKETRIKNLRIQYLEYINARIKNWSNASEILVKYLLDNNKIYTTRSDEKAEVWIYKEGIYIPEGRSEIKEQLRIILTEHYSTFIYNLVMCKIETDTYISAESFFSTNNKDEILLNNGILNLKTENLTSFDSKKIFFNKLPVKYEPGIECPMIDKFLKEVLSKEEDITVFYELAGFSLLKDYRYEKSFMLIGDGRNGKGKSIELLKRLVGIENCSSIPLTSLIPESFQVSELFGKLLNLAGDIGNTDLKETSMFKSLTGRDLVSGKRKFLNSIHFQNHAKFVFACNDLPQVYDLSRGFWDRWILLEYPYTFVQEEEYASTIDKTYIKLRDVEIIDKISTETELSGFLNKALEGLKRLSKNNRFSSTMGTEEVKKQWIRRSNSIIAFCYDHIIEDPEGSIPKKDFRNIYLKYCENHKITPKSEVVIKKILFELFNASDSQTQNFNIQGRYWEGIKLNPNMKL